MWYVYHNNTGVWNSFLKSKLIGQTNVTINVIDDANFRFVSGIAEYFFFAFL